MTAETEARIREFYGSDGEDGGRTEEAVGYAREKYGNLRARYPGVEFRETIETEDVDTPAGPLTVLRFWVRGVIQGEEKRFGLPMPLRHAVASD